MCLLLKMTLRAILSLRKIFSARANLTPKPKIYSPGQNVKLLQGGVRLDNRKFFFAHQVVFFTYYFFLHQVIFSVTFSINEKNTKLICYQVILKLSFIYIFRS